MKIRLTESKLKQIVEESVKNILTELDWKTYANAAKKRAQQKANPNIVRQLDTAANKALRQKYQITGNTHFPYAPEIETKDDEQIGRYPQLGYQSDFRDTYVNPFDDSENGWEMTSYENSPKHKERHQDMHKYFTNQSKYTKGKGWNS